MNDWVSEVLLAWPVMATVRSYRRNHFAHHRYLNTPDDPDWARKRDDPEWAFPQDPLGMIARFAVAVDGDGEHNWPQGMQADGRTQIADEMFGRR